MEKEIRKLIKKYNVEIKNKGRYPDIFDMADIIKDLQFLLEFYQSQNKEIPTIHNTIYQPGEK